MRVIMLNAFTVMQIALKTLRVLWMRENINLVPSFFVPWKAHCLEHSEDNIFRNVTFPLLVLTLDDIQLGSTYNEYCLLELTLVSFQVTYTVLLDQRSSINDDALTFIQQIGCSLLKNGENLIRVILTLCSAVEFFSDCIRTHNKSPSVKSELLGNVALSRCRNTKHHD